MSASARPRRADVLLVEDNAADAELTLECLSLTSVEPRVHHVSDGRQCMAFLRREGLYATAPVPDLVLLDLNMPLMNGREVLAAITSDPKLAHLPVVVLTTSQSPQDVLDMYQLRCSAYMCKPVGFQEFRRALETLMHYWFNVALLPGVPEERR